MFNDNFKKLVFRHGIMIYKYVIMVVHNAKMRVYVTIQSLFTKLFNFTNYCAFLIYEFPLSRFDTLRKWNVRAVSDFSEM